MSRRVRLPGADELFRTTDTALEEGPAGPILVPVPGNGAGSSAGGTAPGVPGASVESAALAPQRGVRQTVRPRPNRGPDRRPSGRISHDEKITVYLSPEELIDLEHVRLGLRQQHGLAADRGRIVREAISVVLEDFESRGEASTLVRRLRSL
jgi:hypothetical protein